MRLTLAAALGLAGLFLATPTPAPADTPAPVPSIYVTGTGSITFSPDVAHLSLGVRAETPSAASSANDVNLRARAVIDALRRLGIPDSQITTSGYDIQYQAPPQPDASQPVQQPVPPAPGEVQSMTIARRPLPAQGTYIATETIDVKTSVAKAGPVLDAAIANGANQSYSLSFDTSQRQSLYRKALARAVTDARAQAAILAHAAGVRLDGIQTISVWSGGGVVEPMAGKAMMATAEAPAQVMGGTGEIDVNVNVVYRIR